MSVSQSLKEKIVVGVATALATTAILGATEAVTGWISAAFFNDPLPVGMIVMTDRECGELYGGWRIYSAAGGRFPLAAGAGTDINGVTRQFVVGQTDNAGEYEHQLSPTELPDHSHTLHDPGHSHGVSGVTYANNGQGHYDQAGGAPVQTARSETNIEVEVSGGGNQGHNNMPPYITLNFCVKT